MKGRRTVHLGFLSLERWDEVWRRNQYFVREFIKQGNVGQVTFVEPAVPDGKTATFEPLPNVRVVRPVLRVPKRLGGIRFLGSQLLSGPIRDIDLLWVNDATLGRWCLRPGVPTVYDVTDDWRESENVPRVRRRIVASEDYLARHATTIVCSEVLVGRWRERYGVDPFLVRNGVDIDSWRDVNPVQLPGPGPHIGYVGTQHEERIDIGLLLQLAANPAVGTVHLVGPNVLSVVSRDRLEASGVRTHGPVPADDVPAWMLAFDVLVSPHVVSSFTLSLDAIKMHEYLAAGKPVVATPTSGFQGIQDPGVLVVPREAFVDAVAKALAERTAPVTTPTPWAERARLAAAILEKVASR